MKEAVAAGAAVAARGEARRAATAVAARAAAQVLQ